MSVSSEPSAWAKAPVPEGEDARARLHEETLRDKRSYLEAGFRPHPCDGCGHRVLVCKTSLRHTSIQWTAEAVRGCPELGARPAGHPALVSGCAKLAASIERAVRSGELPVTGGGTA